MHDSRDELDRLVDSALANYADPGPESGLESRILSRIAVEKVPASRRRWLSWAIAVPATAALLVFILLWHPGTKNSPSVPQQSNMPHQPTHSIEAANQPSSKPALILRGHAPLRKPRSRHKALAAHSAPLPKLDVFPTPEPLSAQEQALVNFAAHASKSERESLVAAQEQADAPLHIAPIQIQPLQQPTAGPN